MTDGTALPVLPPTLPILVGYRARAIQLEQPFEELAHRFAASEGTVALLSGGNLETARHHLLGTHPWLTVTARAGTTVLNFLGHSEALTADPLDVLEALLLRYRIDGTGDLPLAGGLMGYFSYDLKDGLEHLPQRSRDDLKLPDLFLVAPSALLVVEKQTAASTLLVPEFRGDTTTILKLRERAFWARARQPWAPLQKQAAPSSPASSMSRSQYLRAVAAIRAYIAAGDVYQVNMSQRFEALFSGDAFELFARTYHANPAAFFAFIQAGDHQIVSTSPERFLRRTGSHVETRPIKGTRPRSTNTDTDGAHRDDLQTSPKDDAELSMIVDLLRNDLGKVSVPGSVKVTEHKRVEAYKNVYHLVSTIKAELEHHQTSVALLRAAFPGGSITGCPKIRAMEIIDELEPFRRHVYTGSIGYVSFHDTMDLSIAIRTATVTRGRLVFSVGGGIVYDSEPESEYEETLHKGRTLLEAFAELAEADNSVNRAPSSD